MRVVFPFFVVISIFVGLFFLGRYATKKSPQMMECFAHCGDGVCQYNNICYIPPCNCSENAALCPQDCHQNFFVGSFPIC
jgi:hypothetical protein